MNSEKKQIVLLPEDLRNFRSLLDRLNVFRHKCQDLLVRLNSDVLLGLQNCFFYQFYTPN